MNQGTLDGSHSRCVQLSVSSPSDAGSAFNRANGVEICLGKLQLFLCSSSFKRGIKCIIERMRPIF